MRLITATLKNYRMHRDLPVAFDASRTVIGGPNESGKSTLVEAIHRALFTRHKSTVDLDRIRPRHHAGAPEVILEFEAGGHRYTLHKIFKGPSGSVATLTDQTTGDVVAGDAAEDRLRGLLEVPDVGPAQTKGLWSHLWVWQGRAGDDPTSKGVSGESAEKLRRSLVGMTGGGLDESEHDTRTYELIAAAHAGIYGARGVVLRNSDLHEARARLEEARAAALQAATELQEFEAAATEVLDAETQIESCQRTLVEAEESLSRARTSLADIEALEATIVRQRDAATAAADDYQTLVDGDAAIRAIETSLTELRAEHAPREVALERLIAHTRRMQAAVSDAVTALTTASASQQEITAQRELLESLAMLATLTSRRADLEERRRRIATVQAEIDELDATLRGLPVLDEQHLAELRELELRLQIARGTLAAIATRIEVLSAAATVTIDDTPVQAGSSTTLTDAADLVVGGGTTIRVTPGGGRTLAEVRVEIASLGADLGTRVSALGVPDVAAAARAFDDRAAATALRTQRVAAIAQLNGERNEQDLATTIAAIEALRADIERKRPPGYELPVDAAALAAARDRAEGRFAEAMDAQRRAQVAVQDAQEAAAAAVVQQADAEATLAEERGTLQRLEGQKAMLEQLYGGDREAALQQRAGVMRTARQALEASERALADRGPQTVRDDVNRLTRTVAMTIGQVADARERQANARGRLQRAGTVDLHGARAVADARLELAARRHADVDRRARAIDRLRQVFDARRQAVAARLAEPLRRKVAEYLDALFGAGSRVSVALTNDGLGDLKVSRPAFGGLEFDFGTLSGGTKEQVAAACRLAMAELLAGGDAAGCLPIVFDDAFVNSDPVRIREVQRVLDLGARRGLQIIVLSCNPAEYGLLGARMIQLQRPTLSASAHADEVPMSAEAERPVEEVDGSSVSGADGGGMPAGGDVALAAALVAALAATPERSAGNHTLRERLGWDEDTYERIRQQLITQGRLEKGRGRGGSVRLVDAPDLDT